MTTGIAAPAMAEARGAGSPNAATDSSLGAGSPGVLADTAPLTRYWWLKKDHMSSVFHPGEGYAAEFVLGQIHTTAQPGTHPLFQCTKGSDRFTSPQFNCEGFPNIGLIGYAYSTPPAAPNRAFYRCLVRSNGEHFDSNDPNCEGQRPEGLQGYLLL
ncbi:hypothetical protein [Micromonospora cathayae]|uniref:Uncharacterized protein n=1 Tax=Micromonospora cathayae TaxID=3028804 RepID=A0ABY7ZMZ8_9ACTN|nr:hypothetical protein [Micromonospora sp. HUAS 3]WDZ84136.1 hypothetical protein PVK37_27340 [Micromonospora sp. HUAS 3]